MCPKISILVFTVMLAVISVGCRREETGSADNGGVLVQVGDSSLTMQDVLLRIPPALSPEDSTEMFHRIVDTWVRRMVLNEVAEKNIPDLNVIEQMVEEYRADLIIQRYLANMEGAGANEVSDARVREYFEQHRSELVLDAPLVKGIFVKVPDNDSEAANLRKWMAKGDGESIDKIEKSGLRHALQYEYFIDHWVDWNSIAEQIPYRFFDADAFVETTRNFETSYGGSLYMLHISAYVPSGKEMPEDYAATKIRDMLRREDMVKYRENLIGSIYKNEMNKGLLKPGLYDPVAGKMKGEKYASPKDKAEPGSKPTESAAPETPGKHKPTK